MDYHWILLKWAWFIKFGMGLQFLGISDKLPGQVGVDGLGILFLSKTLDYVKKVCGLERMWPAPKSMDLIECPKGTSYSKGIRL